MTVGLCVCVVCLCVRGLDVCASLVLVWVCGMLDEGVDEAEGTVGVDVDVVVERNVSLPVPANRK